MGYDRRASDRGLLKVWYSSNVLFKPLWLLTMLSTVATFVLAFLAGNGGIADEGVRSALWVASFVAGVVATLFAYLGTMSWARRRKRLWG